MKKTIAVILLLCMALCFAAGCGLSASESSVSNDSVSNESVSNESYPEISVVITAKKTYDFDFEVMDYISKNYSGNYMVSPLSFKFALGLLTAGANGDTLNELLNVLGVDTLEELMGECAAFNSFVKKFDEDLKADIDRFYANRNDYSDNAKAPNRALSVANSVWKRADIEEAFVPTYKQILSSTFKAELFDFTLKDFVSNVNSWVNTKTNGFIKKLLDDNYSTTNIAFCLMNALYFKDAWVSSFNASATASGDFKTSSGKTVKKDFMNKVEELSYYKDNQTELVILPMGGNIDVVFVLGSSQGILGKIQKATKYEVTLKIPKFEIESSFSNSELVDFLKANGVKLAFDSQKADFSKMIAHDIFVDDIIQRTHFKIDEEGVEAAAVTAIIMKEGAINPVSTPKASFIADESFSFYILADTQSGTEIMFGGEVRE